MNRIDELFRKLKKNKRSGVFPFVVAGYPDLEMTEKIILELAKKGADLIEIGVPFSDPVADGPVIQEAAQQAILKNTNLDSIFGMVKNLRQQINTPLVLMSYYNPIYHYGLKVAVDKAFASGVDGFIVPDLPVELSMEFKKQLDKKDLRLIYLLSINSGLDRIKKILKEAKGFLYLVSRLGVTGSSEIDYAPIKKKVNEIRKVDGNIPIAVGFGVSNKKQVEELSKISDAVIIGSALVKVIKNSKTSREVLKNVGEFMERLR